MIEFQAWPKIARLNREMVVTEKIDGTNAAVIVEPVDARAESPVGAILPPGAFRTVEHEGELYAVAVQSRKRLISPESDSFGFAAWVHENAASLVATLGAGRHFGEWWGSGIRRGYGLTKGDKRFSLFNVKRYGEVDFAAAGLPSVSTVPVLYDQGPFDLGTVQQVLDRLASGGSFAAPGYDNPEGVVVFHVAANQLFKATIHGDEAPKGVAA